MFKTWFNQVYTRITLRAEATVRQLSIFLPRRLKPHKQHLKYDRFTDGFEHIVLIIFPTTWFSVCRFLQHKHMQSKLSVYLQIPGSCPSHHTPLAWPMSLDTLKGRSLQSEITGLCLPGRKKDNAENLLPQHGYLFMRMFVTVNTLVLCNAQEKCKKRIKAREKQEYLEKRINKKLNFSVPFLIFLFF